MWGKKKESKKSNRVIESLFIKELIRRVHQELLESQEEREKSNQAPLFKVEEMTIEVNFVAIESKEMKGGLDFKVIAIGGVDLSKGKKYQQQQIHKITLTLRAIPSGHDETDKVSPRENGGKGVPRGVFPYGGLPGSFPLRQQLPR